MYYVSIQFSRIPQGRDGFSAHLMLEDRPLITLNMKSAKGQFPQVYLRGEDVARLTAALNMGMIPLLPVGGLNERDGVLHTLRIEVLHTDLELVWGSELPETLRAIEPIVAIFESYARDAGLIT